MLARTRNKTVATTYIYWRPRFVTAAERKEIAWDLGLNDLRGVAWTALDVYLRCLGCFDSSVLDYSFFSFFFFRYISLSPLSLLPCRWNRNWQCLAIERSRVTSGRRSLIKIDAVGLCSCLSFSFFLFSLSLSLSLILHFLSILILLGHKAVSSRRALSSS